MPKNHVIIVRVSETQFERILGDAQAKGHKTISGYIRDSMLGWEYATQTKIHRIFEAVVEKKPEHTRGRVGKTLLEYIEV